MGAAIFLILLKLRFHTRGMRHGLRGMRIRQKMEQRVNRRERFHMYGRIRHTICHAAANRC